MLLRIRKVLIAEDHESANISVQKTLESFGIVNADYVYYCDDAIVKIQKAIQAGISYDLLITDLHFEKDHRAVQIKDGEELIKLVRAIQPDLSILVFSAEGKSSLVAKFFSDGLIDGYVRKARGDAKELLKAISKINEYEIYKPPFLVDQIRHNKAHQFTHFDVIILSLMTEGKRQAEISEHLKKNNIQPSGLSSIEKRLNQIKEALDFSTNEQLIAHCVKMGII